MISVLDHSNLSYFSYLLSLRVFPHSAFVVSAMSFFGLPEKPAHNSRMPGFGQAPDHFAGLSSKSGTALDDDEGWVLKLCTPVQRTEC